MLPEKFRTTLVTAPPLPRNYLPRPEALERLRDAVITDEPGPSVALTALNGMGGIGKTVLAQALSQDEAVQHAFPDGIVWTTVGKEPVDNLVTRLQVVRQALGDVPAANETELYCIARYRTIISRTTARETFAPGPSSSTRSSVESRKAPNGVPLPDMRL